MAARVTEGHLAKLRRYRADGVRASTTEAKYCGRHGLASKVVLNLEGAGVCLHRMSALHASA